MTKLMVIPTHTNVNSILDYADAFLLGYTGLSMNFVNTVNIDEIEKLNVILKKHNKQLWIALNKNFHNNELSNVKEIMEKLSKMGISGILYYDVAVLQMKREYQIDIPLIWGAEHLTTNYATMNYWHSFGADMAYVSGEITKKEILEIKKNTTMPLIVPVFGHLPMFVSERHEVKNYLTHFQISDNSSIYYMEKEGKRYPVIDNDYGTFVYSHFILNGYQEYLEFEKSNIDYVLLNGQLIDEDVFASIVKMFYQKNGSDQAIDELVAMPTDKGFYYKETVYQVKNYEN